MPLQQIQTKVFQISEPVVPRYDTADVQEIIGLAHEMQARHRETLPLDEVEALGHEMGVETEFVRRAALQWEARDRKQVQKPLTLTRRQKVASLVPFPLYMLTVALLLAVALLMKWDSTSTPTHDSHHRHNTGSTTPVLYNVIWFGLFLVLPAILAFGTGFLQKNKRGGAKIGALYGLAPLLSVALYMLYVAVTQSSVNSETLVQEILWGFSIFCLLLGTWLGMGALCGVGGVIVRQKISGLRHKKRTAKPA